MDLCRLLVFEVSAHTCVCGAMAFLQYDTGTATIIPVLLQLEYNKNSMAFMADQYTPRTKVNIWGNTMVNTVATVHHIPPVSGILTTPDHKTIGM